MIVLRTPCGVPYQALSISEHDIKEINDNCAWHHELVLPCVTNCDRDMRTVDTIDKD